MTPSPQEQRDKIALCTIALLGNVSSNLVAAMIGGKSGSDLFILAYSQLSEDDLEAFSDVSASCMSFIDLQYYEPLVSYTVVSEQPNVHRLAKAFFDSWYHLVFFRRSSEE